MPIDELPSITPGIARECRILRNIPVPMRDGVRLATSVFLPPDDGPWPVVLERSPYNRVQYYDRYFPRKGIALVAQDVRGRYASEGEWYPFANEAADGADTVAWLRAQPWCDGRIGMFGDSYLGWTQYAIAMDAGEHVTTLVPRFMAGDLWKRVFYNDGAFALALSWSWLCFESPGRTSENVLMLPFDIGATLRELPVVSLDGATGASRVPVWREYLAHSTYDEHWRALDIRDRLDRFTMPVLLVGGWYDGYTADVLRLFRGMRRAARTEAIRRGHRIIVGPWPHGVSPSTILGEIDFGSAAIEQNAVTYFWLDCLLRGGEPAEILPKPVRIFVMGANRWRDEDDWPPPDAREVPYYLRGDGLLSAKPPGDEGADRYDYDPANPVPTLGGLNIFGSNVPGISELVKPGPYDQRPIETRDDVLTYTSEPLDRDTEVTGNVSVTLWAATSARDTDFVARLSDVHPDGRSMLVVEGIIRARFRDGVWGAPSLLEPGRAHPYTIDLQATSMLFRRGHRIRLAVTSSCFPLWDRNLNTGEDPGTGTDMAVARQTIFHDRDRPSHVVLPIVARDR